MKWQHYVYSTAATSQQSPVIQEVARSAWKLHAYFQMLQTWVDNLETGTVGKSCLESINT